MNRHPWWHVVLAEVVLVCALPSCATSPPPVRPVPTEYWLEAKEATRLSNERYNAEELIEAAQECCEKRNPARSEFFRQDVLSFIGPLRQALQSDSADSIRAHWEPLAERLSLLAGAERSIEGSTKRLSELGAILSPALRMEVKNRIRAVQTALRGKSWEELRGSTDSLDWIDSRRLSAAVGYREINNNLRKLGSGLGPKLRADVVADLQPLKLALQGRSWDDVANCYADLPSVVFQIRTIVTEIEVGRQGMEVLQPSERWELQLALADVDDALRGESWDQVISKIDAIRSSKQRLGLDQVFHRSPCLRILSIDGGGVRGIVPAMILAELERRTRKSVAEMFDVIVGTSTGGIMALGLTRPDPKYQNRPRYSAADIVKLYENESGKIFPAGAFKTVRGLFGPKYSTQGLEEVLKGYLGDAKLRDAVTNVIIPAYELEERKHIFFSTYKEAEPEVYMWEVARATSAAPTYFPPFRIPIYPVKIGDRTKHELTLVDGGVYANNPAPYALSGAKSNEHGDGKKPYDAEHPLLLLSLGTGQVPPSTRFEEAWHWGLVGWAGPILDIAFSDPGIEDETTALINRFDYYFRFQPRTLTDSMSTLDDASVRNILDLKRMADEYIRNEQTSRELDRVATLLKRERPSECRVRQSR